MAHKEFVQKNWVTDLGDKRNNDYLHNHLMRCNPLYARIVRRNYKNVCRCHAYGWPHHRGVGRCGK